MDHVEFAVLMKRLLSIFYFLVLLRLRCRKGFFLIFFLRSDKVLRLDKKQQGRIYFGQNLVCKESLTEGKGKMVKVGDSVFVLNKVSSAAEAVLE
ncbi:hypothetical protein PTKIN_Ptkin16aG0053600 [Pterospermum kingtungense]